MGKIKFEITDDKLLKQPKASQELSILIGMDSFTYMVSDADQFILTLKDFSYGTAILKPTDLEKQVKTIFAEENYFNAAPKKVKIAFLNAKSTLVPDRLFNGAEEKTYLSQVTALEDNDQIKTDQLTQVEAKNVYALDRQLLNLSLQQFPGASICHISTALLNGFQQVAAKREKTHQLFLHVRTTEVYTFLFEGGNLKFSNSFPYQSTRDFIYYILMIYDQFKLETERNPVYLSGQLLKDSDVYRLLFRYINNIEFVDPPANYKYGANWGTYPKYFYFDVLSLTYCN